MAFGWTEIVLAFVTAIAVGADVAVGLGGYFLPFILAYTRGHHAVRAILLVNLFLGWTVIAWIVTLVWACSSNAQGFRSRRD